jgi:hypothetical protein
MILADPTLQPTEDEILLDGPPPSNSTNDFSEDDDSFSSPFNSTIFKNSSLSGAEGGNSTTNGARKTLVRYYIDIKTGMKVKIIVNEPPKVEFMAKISQVNMKGVMTVQFNDKIAIPQNYSKFNDQFIKMRVVRGEEDGEDKNISAWNITAFRDKEMDIQINFTNPMGISPTLVSFLYLFIDV